MQVVTEVIEVHDSYDCTGNWKHGLMYRILQIMDADGENSIYFAQHAFT
jgi:hypothetical protein